MDSENQKSTTAKMKTALTLMTKMKDKQKVLTCGCSSS